MKITWLSDYGGRTLPSRRRRSLLVRSTRPPEVSIHYWHARRSYISSARSLWPLAIVVVLAPGHDHL
jgi:hypothetical protein